MKKDFDQARRPAPKQATGTKRGKGSDAHSNRASEERHSSVPATGRGQKRGRDYELDRVSNFCFRCSPHEKSHRRAVHRHNVHLDESHCHSLLDLTILLSCQGWGPLKYLAPFAAAYHYYPLRFSPWLSTNHRISQSTSVQAACS